MNKKTLIFSALVLFFFFSLFSEVLCSQGKIEKVPKGWLGVYVTDIDEEIMGKMGLESENGVLISDVVEDSPAEKAGLEKDDVIISFDGKKVKGVNQFIRLVGRTEPGDEVEIKVIRDKEERVFSVQMGTEPKYGLEYQDIEGKEKIQPKMFTFQMISPVRIGVSLENLTEQLGEYFGVENGEGALITEVDLNGSAFRSGLKAGDIIIKVDGVKIKDVDNIREALSEKKPKEKAKIEVVRKGEVKVFTVEVMEREEWFPEFSKEIEKIEKLTIPSKKPYLEKKIIIEKEDLRKELDRVKEELKELQKELRELQNKVR
jgi:serine protease Do